jgi:hypothetical protein
MASTGPVGGRRLRAPDPGVAVFLVDDLEGLAVFGGPGALGLDDERQCLVRRDGDRSRRQG